LFAHYLTSSFSLETLKWPFAVSVSSCHVLTVLSVITQGLT